MNILELKRSARGYFYRGGYEGEGTGVDFSGADFSGSGLPSAADAVTAGLANQAAQQAVALADLAAQEAAADAVAKGLAAGKAADALARAASSYESAVSSMPGGSSPTSSAAFGSFFSSLFGGSACCGRAADEHSGCSAHRCPPSTPSAGPNSDCSSATGRGCCHPGSDGYPAH